MGFLTLDDDTNVGRQPPASMPWLQQSKILQNSAPANAQIPARGTAPAGAPFIAYGGGGSAGAKDWGGHAGPSFSTLLPPGEQHTSAMLLSLYPAHIASGDPPSENPSFPPTGAADVSRLRNVGIAVRPLQPPGPLALSAGPRSSGGQHLLFAGDDQGGARLAPLPLHVGPPRPLSGEHQRSGPATALAAPSTASHANTLPRQLDGSPEELRAVALDAATARGQDRPQHRQQHRGPGPASGAAPAAPPSAELDRGRPGSDGSSDDDMDAGEGEGGDPAAAAPMDMDHDQEGGAAGARSTTSGASMCATLNSALAAAATCDWTAGRESCGLGGDTSSGGAHEEAEDMAVKHEHGAVSAGPLSTTDAAGAAEGGPGSGSPVQGPRQGGDDVACVAAKRPALAPGCAAGGGAPGSSNDGGSAPGQPDSASNEDGLQLLATHFRNRPGRVSKAVAKLGPIAELAKSAATGKIKLEKAELHELVATVETSLAKAVTEAKEDSRARNRVAQQRFRNRQRDTIAALQAKVDEQAALIAALQDKIQLYEQQDLTTAAEGRQQMNNTVGGGGAGWARRANRRGDSE